MHLRQLIDSISSVTFIRRPCDPHIAPRVLLPKWIILSPLACLFRAGRLTPADTPKGVSTAIYPLSALWSSAFSLGWWLGILARRRNRLR